MNEIEIPGQRILPSLELIRLDEPGEATMLAINRLSKRNLKPEDVHVRRTYVIHDAVDTEFTRFPVESIDQVARLLPGTPVLIGHARMSDQLPQAMTFAGERVKRTDVVQPKDIVPGVGDGNWGAADFYWPRGRSDAQDLAVNIDTGIIRETSLRWGFKKPVCSHCGMDMRECDHMPGEIYEGRVAWMDMHDIRRVREWSFVPRGGQLGTDLQLMRGAARKTAEQVVDEFLKREGLAVDELERSGMIELARCYDPTRKLSKKDQARGWFGNLPKRPSRLSWFART